MYVTLKPSVGPIHYSQQQNRCDVRYYRNDTHYTTAPFILPLTMMSDSIRVSAVVLLCYYVYKQT